MWVNRLVNFRDTQFKPLSLPSRYLHPFIYKLYFYLFIFSEFQDQVPSDTQNTQETASSTFHNYQTPYNFLKWTLYNCTQLKKLKKAIMLNFLQI